MEQELVIKKQEKQSLDPWTLKKLPPYEVSIKEYRVIPIRDERNNPTGATSLKIEATIKMNQSKYTEIRVFNTYRDYTIQSWGLEDNAGAYSDGIIDCLRKNPKDPTSISYPWYYEETVSTPYDIAGWNADYGFRDHPTHYRPSDGPNHTLVYLNEPNQATIFTTSFMGKTESGSWERITTFSWGYTNDANGNMIKFPLLQDIVLDRRDFTSGQPFHLNNLPR